MPTTGTILAKDAQVSPAPEIAKSSSQSPWEITGAAGLAVSDGNSDSVACSLQLLASYQKDKNEAYLGVDYFYAESEDVTSTDSLKLFGQYNRDIGDRWYVGGYGSYFRDNASALDYRTDVSALLGYHILKSNKTTLSFEAGPGYAWESRDAESDSFPTLRLAERFEYRFSATSKLWQSLGWTPRTDDPSDSIIELEAGIETRITRKVSLRTFVRHRVDDTPGDGNGKSDTSLLLGLAYDFNGLPDPSAGSEARRSLMPGTTSSAAKKDGWKTTAALGLSANRGNAEKTGLTFDWNTAYISSEREFFFDLGYNYGENDGETANDRLISRVQENRYLSDRFFIGSGVSFLRDEPAEIAYRVAPSVVAGYSFIKTDRTKLSFEAGPSYTFEKTGEDTDNFASAVAAQRFSHTFNERFALKQSVTATSELENLENFNAIAAISLDTTLSDRLIWRIGANYGYENIPADGREHHDAQLTSSIAVRF
ncbi:DUF481 domain-containing protein [Luteolibacter pohnpeiensis]|uniref:DUF481 domain-containing protein n=1 Tax=Luteolibacter pohnpeiensis TaxID=454153 RepID=A0A934S9F7_9BACT|nr:DUF481 domain-containing protein [Luteolibacter pohnpeiensis]MBK1881253.1 DUF481 domain-containing protein [Luteolibacter pohnpeiensis]